MNQAQRKRLEADGWRIGDAKDFLGLSDAEQALIDIKISLANELRRCRAAHGITQTKLAKLVRSSQARVARMEAGDPSVSVDLLLRTLLAAGATPNEIARVIAGGPRRVDYAKAPRSAARKVAERKR